MLEYQKENQAGLPTLDETTPWYEFLSYLDCCQSLNPPGQPNINRFLSYRNYLKSVGVIE